MRALIPFAAALVFAGAPLAQQPRPAPSDAPENHRPPLFFREAWKHSGTPEHPISQDSVASANLELKLYGEAPRPNPDFAGIWDNKRAQPLDDPAHAFTGTCTRPCGLTLRDKNSYVDLTGFAKIGWRVKTEGFHVLRPLVKLADGTYLVGDHSDGYTPDWHVSEFTLFDLRWRRLDPEKVVTLTGKQAGWVTNPDLSKVDEVGFVDLMPGSGHGNGGWSDVAWIEVYGRPVPRSGAGPGAAVTASPAAPPANPLTAELLQSYIIIKTNLLKMAQKMPDQDYSFKPVPEVETFTQRVAHIARANYRTCAGVNGETRSLDTAGKTSKADLVRALQESFAYCDEVFTSLTDARALEMVPGRIGSPPTTYPRTRLSTLWNVVRHSNELYGYMAVYLRLKGVVPPSSSPD